ncbi:UNVERIFIED_CONTAM: hypothetical protein FKN15_058281 [Acipenser sinensis]
MEGYEEMEGTGTQFKKPKRKRRKNIDDTVSVKRSGTEETGSVICAEKVKYGASVREESAVASLTRSTVASVGDCSEDVDSDRGDSDTDSSVSSELSASQQARGAANGPVIRETGQIVSEPAESAGVDNEEAVVQKPSEMNKGEGESVSLNKAEQTPAEAQWKAQQVTVVISREEAQYLNRCRKS